MTVNYDPEEIAKFNAMASQWWDVLGECRPLHELNPLRLKVVLEHTSLTQKNVLDIGCGGGIFTESLAKENGNVTGIDLADSALKVAKLHKHEGNLSILYENSSAEAYAADHAECFDVVTCMELIEHVPEPASLVKACAALTKPGGYLFISTLNRTLRCYLEAILGAEYLLQMLPKGTHTYAKFIKPSELAQWARCQGLAMIGLNGIHYDLILRQFQLTQNVDVNYIACFQK